MYKVFVKSENSKRYMNDRFGEHIKKKGIELIHTEALVGIKGDDAKNGDPIKFTEALLALRDRIDRFVKDSF